MTQERFLEVDSLPVVDFFMIDGFYKLGSCGRRDSRRTVLNLAWNKLKAKGAQYYLIGPNIDALDEGLSEGLHEQLVRTDFKTVAVDIWDRSDVDDQRSDLQHLMTRELTGSTIVFTGSPAKAESLANFLASNDFPTDGRAADVADWISTNYDPSWEIVPALRGGIGVHSGPLPRALQRLMVRLFNDGLVQTSVYFDSH